MEIHRKSGIMIPVVIIIFLVVSTKPSSAASRPLKGDQNPSRMDHHHNDRQQDFTESRSPVPPSGSSPCTHIPKGGENCPPNR
ncbi:hypothetical protein SLE2022_246540 [Rubroshorea leprosula]